jgi:hypothetical protein
MILMMIRSMMFLKTEAVMAETMAETMVEQNDPHDQEHF